jgi:oligosaccharide repeat unit polymerase
MTDILFIFLFFIVPIVALYLIKGANISLLQISIPSILFLFSFLFSYLGILPLYYQWDEYRAAVGIVDKDILLKIFLVSSLSILITAFGIFFTRHFLNLKPIRYRPPKGGLSVLSMAMIFLISIVCTLILVFYVQQIHDLPLFAVFSGDHGKAALLRSSAVNAFAGKYHRYYLFFGKILPFASYLLLASALVNRRILSFLIFSLVFLISLFASVMLLEKAPSAELILGILLVYLLIKKNGSFPLKYFVKVSICLFMILIPSYIYFSGSETTISAIKSILSRIFTGNLHAAYYYFEIFPGQHEYLYGQSFPNPAGIFPFENFNLPVEVSKYAFPDIAKKGIVGSAPTTFWAEMYVNFGLMGPLMVSFIIGIAVYALHVLLSKLEDSTIKVALITWTSLHIKNLSMTSLSSFIFDTYMIAILVIASTLLFIEGNGSIFFKKSCAKLNR